MNYSSWQSGKNDWRPMTVEEAIAIVRDPVLRDDLCDADRFLANEVEQLRAEMASPDGLLSYAEIRARLLKLEIENTRLKASLNHVAGERDRMAAEAAKGARDGRD